MKRPPFEVADIIRAVGNRFQQRFRLNGLHRKILSAIERCRTAALGGHRDRCTRCGYDAAISYNSCRNRHCPKCQAGARDQWLAAREGELLPVAYVHVVFTIPRQLADVAFHNKRLLYGLLFRTSAATLLEFAADPKHLGAEIGFLSVLHSWGQTLVHHPHVHCVVPAGGLSPDHKAWVRSHRRFFLPVKALSRVFRGKFVDALERAYHNNELCLPGALKPLRQEKAFRSFVRSLHQQDWVVYAKPPFGGPRYVLNYLARYTHRVAISNHRLVAFADGKVTFRWKDYAHGNKQRLMTLTAEAFLRRFLQHVLPPRFVRIRFFGFLSPRKRGALLPLCQQLLATDASSSVPAVPREKREPVAWTCPLCGGPMMLLERLDAWQLQQKEGKYFDTS